MATDEDLRVWETDLEESEALYHDSSLAEIGEEVYFHYDYSPQSGYDTNEEGDRALQATEDMHDEILALEARVFSDDEDMLLDLESDTESVVLDFAESVLDFSAESVTVGLEFSAESALEVSQLLDFSAVI
jgi:hypothetical protein